MKKYLTIFYFLTLGTISNSQNILDDNLLHARRYFEVKQWFSKIQKENNDLQIEYELYDMEINELSNKSGKYIDTNCTRLDVIIRRNDSQIEYQIWFDEFKPYSFSDSIVIKLSSSQSVEKEMNWIIDNVEFKKVKNNIFYSSEHKLYLYNENGKLKGFLLLKQNLNENLIMISNVYFDQKTFKQKKKKLRKLTIAKTP